MNRHHPVPEMCLQEVLRLHIADSAWKHLSLIGGEEVVSLSHAKVYVFADSVLCLGKMNQNPTSHIVWERQLDWFKDSSKIRILDTIDGEPMEFQWHVSQDSLRCSSSEKSNSSWTKWANPNNFKYEFSSCRCSTCFGRTIWPIVCAKCDEHTHTHFWPMILRNKKIYCKDTKNELKVIKFVLMQDSWQQLRSDSTSWQKTLKNSHNSQIQWLVMSTFCQEMNIIWPKRLDSREH